MIAGCFTRTGSNKVQIFTEMHYSQSYRSQEIPRLLPPEGAIPIDGKGIEYSPEEAKEVSNPIPNNSSVLSKFQFWRSNLENFLFLGKNENRNALFQGGNNFDLKY